MGDMSLPEDHPLYTYVDQYSRQLNWAMYYVPFIEGTMQRLSGYLMFSDPDEGPVVWKDFKRYLVQFMYWCIGSNWLPDQFPQLEFMNREYDYWGGSIDMDAILNAMLAAKPDQVTQFVGIEQAYMGAIWNAPYNHEMYAALARGFRQWA